MSPAFRSALGFLALTTLGHAADIGNSITISDKNFIVGGSNAWYNNHEDNETENNPNTITLQKWDLEGMFQQGDQLTLVAGFNFQLGTIHDRKTYKSGDIFIDINNDARWGPGMPSPFNSTSPFGTPAPYNTFSNNLGWDYAIHFNAGVTAYEVYALSTSSLFSKATDVASSNPWIFVPDALKTGLLRGSTAIATRNNAPGDVNTFGTLDASGLTTFGSGETFNLTSPAPSYAMPATGLTGGTHYYLTVDTSFLPNDTLATYHYTIECGNDNLAGQARTVPDSATTFTLLCGAFASLIAFRRKFVP